MIKHTLEISQRPARLSLDKKQLILKAGELERQYACEDIGVLILEHPAISLSCALLNQLMDAGSVVLICGKNHLPTGMLLPTVTHTELVPRMQAQLSADLPSQKRVWKAIVQEKIKAQASLITQGPGKRLLTLAQRVKSGDPENLEAQAARIYWKALFPEQYANGIRRNPQCTSLFNACLNYGYSIIRAATARAIVSAGLQPALGVFHHRRSNPFCLADDIMEPLRPMVDNCVRDILESNESGDTELAPKFRQKLLSLLTAEVTCGTYTGPLMAALPRYVNSFFRLLTKETSTLHPPRLCTYQDTDVCG